MGNSVGSRYRYGASFVDRTSGVRFEGHHPVERPDLWKIYLNEAEGRYRNFGTEDALRRQILDDGDGVPLFFLGFDAHGEPVAGVRVHGPLDASYQAILMQEMGGSPEINEIACLIDNEVRLGALEIKGAWSKGEAVVGAGLAVALSRCVTHAMNWLGAEFAIAAVSDSWLALGKDTGARMVGTASVPFPDDRYRTIALSWRRSRSQELCSPPHQKALRIEGEELSRGPTLLGSGPLEPESTRTRAWRPLVLDMKTRAQREVLRVLREDPSLQVIDRLPDQLEQLAQIKPTPSQAVLEEGQRWVYYPWRQAVVRLLAPRAFATLRLDRNRNKLTRDEQARQRALRIGVVGLSAGHSIAHVLAMEGLAGELRLADFDTIELSNLNRIPASVLDLGVNKSIVAARRIGEIDPYLRVETVPEGIHADNLGNFLDGLDLVIEECDSLDVKLLVREMARERRIPVLMETSDRGVLDVERFDLEPNRPIFHGLLGSTKSSELAGLTLAEKAPYVLRMLGAEDVSSRGAASFLELAAGAVTGWPQLGSEVTLGAATAAAAVRRIGLAGELPSGRVRFDVEEVLAGVAPVVRGCRVRDGTSGREAGPVSARRCRSDRCHRRCRPMGPIGRQHSAVALRGGCEGNPHVPRSGAHDHDGRGTPGQLRRDRGGPLQWPRRRRRAEETWIDPPVPRGIPVPPRRHVAGRIIDRPRDRPTPASPTDAGGQPPGRRPLPDRRRGRPTAGSGCRTGRGPVTHPHRPRSHGDLRRSVGRVRSAPLPHPEAAP